MLRGMRTFVVVTEGLADPLSWSETLRDGLGDLYYAEGGYAGTPMT